MSIHTDVICVPQDVKVIYTLSTLNFTRNNLQIFQELLTVTSETLIT
jgi:hypothetical protein